MKLTFGRAAAHIIGGGTGALFGFYLPIFVVLCMERGHEVEASLAQVHPLGVDILMLMSGLTACLFAWVGSWLLPRRIYPSHRS